MKPIFQTMALVGLTALLAGCIGNGPLGVRGEGPMVERKLDLGTIKGISLPSSAEIWITQGKTQEIRVEGQENILELLNKDVIGEVWSLDFEKPVWDHEPLRVFMTVETLRSIRLSGSGSIETTGRFRNIPDLEVNLSGSGKIRADIEAGKVNARISGSGAILLDGSAEDLDLDISGSGNIRAFPLKATRADTRISGSGGMEISVSEKLEARISGSGNIVYQGDPDVKSRISGSGDVRSR